MNTIVVDKNLKDIYNIVISDKYIKSIYKNAKIKYFDKNIIKFINKYKKDLVSYYDDDLLNIIKNLFLIDFIVLSIEQNIKYNNNGFILQQILCLKNKYDNDIILSTILNNYKIFIEFDYSNYKYDSNKTIIRLLDVRIIENNNFITNKPYNIDYDNVLKPIIIDDYLQYYNKCKKDFFISDIKYSDNIIINFINIIADKSISSEYMRNIVEYYNNNNISIYSIL